MSVTSAQILQDIIDGVLTGGNRTKAIDVRGILNNIVNSTPNVKDGGNVFETLIGYSTLVSITGNQTLVHKKYVDDAIAAAGGGGFTAIAPEGNLLRVKTVGPGNVVLTAEASHISETTYSMQAIINGAGSQIIWGTSDPDTSDTSSFQSNPEAAVLMQTNGAYLSEFKAALGELYVRSTSAPLGSSGALGIDNTGKLFTTGAGISLSTTLDGLNVTGSTITSSDSIISAFGALQNQINGVLGGAIVQGNWNATTNSPSLADGVGTNGHYYVTNVAGTTNFGSGPITFAVGDWAIYYTTSNTWNKVDNSDAVVLVNGSAGSVTITTTGTTDRITVTGGSGLTPTIDIASNYAGQSSIVTIGTLVNGTVPAARVSAGTFGSGAYTISTSLSTPSLIGTSGQLAFTSVAQSSGAIIDYLFTPSSHTGQTASTNTPVFRVASATKTLATGALAAWYANHFQTQTIAFSGASIVADAFGAYFESVTQGTLATLTNSYSLGTSGFVKFGSGLSGVIIRNDFSTNNYCGFYNASPTPSATNYFLKSNGTTTLLNATSGGVLYLAFGGAGVLSISSASSITIADGVTINAGTTTGWKIGGSTSQKMALWNKTPIVQPTTAIAGASFVSNGGTALTSTDTFGGYTVAQAIAAMINFGQLA